MAQIRNRFTGEIIAECPEKSVKELAEENRASLEGSQPGWSQPGWSQPEGSQPGGSQPGWSQPVASQPGWSQNRVPPVSLHPPPLLHEPR